MATNIQHVADLLGTYMSEETFNALCAEIGLDDDNKYFLSYTVLLKYPYSLNFHKHHRFQDIQVSISADYGDKVKGTSNRVFFRPGMYKEFLYDIVSIKPIFHIMSLMENGSKKLNYDVIHNYLKKNMPWDTLINVKCPTDGLHYIHMRGVSNVSIRLCTLLDVESVYKVTFINTDIENGAYAQHPFKFIVYVKALNTDLDEFIERVTKELIKDSEIELFDMLWVLGISFETPPEHTSYFDKLELYLAREEDVYPKKDHYEKARYNKNEDVLQLNARGLLKLPDEEFGGSSEF